MDERDDAIGEVIRETNEMLPMLMTKDRHRELTRAERQVAAVREVLDGMIDESPNLDPGQVYSVAQVVDVLRYVRSKLEVPHD